MRDGLTRLREAVRFTRHGPATLRQVFVGGLLVAGSLAVLPAAVVAGYLVEVLDTGASGGSDPPVFGQWSALISTGWPALLIAACYGIVPLVGLGLVARRVIHLPASGIVPQVTIAPVDVALSIGCAVVLLALVPAAVTAYARERRIRAAFDLGQLWTVLTDGSYLFAVTLVFLLGVATLVVTGVALLFTYGSAVLLAPLLVFYILVVACYVIGSAYGEAIGDISAADRGPTEFEQYL